VLDEGSLLVRLGVAQGRVADVSVTYDRPGRAAQALAGRSPAELLALVPRLFSVCSVAQTVACARALEAALGEPAAPGLEACRDVACLAEACASHVWQLGLAWRDAAEVAPDLARVAQARHALGDLCVALFGSASVAGSLPTAPAWEDARASLDALASRVQDLAAGETPLEQRVQASDRAGFAGLIARLRARRAGAVADAEGARARLLDAERGARVAPPRVAAPGQGTGDAQTARGLLHHRVRTTTDRVEAFESDSPTDRTFCSGGVLRDALAGTEAGPTLARDAGWLVLALDPCVPWSIEVRDA
jgi:Ni,Fe-hydrogenase I large subunit